ncbi:MAG TPA: hypothetical protein VFI16_02860, partial [Anaeromyxobacteraceae bacterium]|nr:hypothetical protein [Anaeromyxobacteraceae bacterium]
SPADAPSAGAAPGSPEAEVGRQAQRLWRAVATCDLAGMLDFVPPEGLFCGDRFLGKAELDRQLRDRLGELRTFLCDEASFRERHAQPGEGPSVAAFFQQKGLTIRVEWAGRSRDEANAYFQAGESASFLQVVLVRRSGRWVVLGYPFCR